MINVPYSIECWVLYLWVCAFFPLGVHSQTAGSGFSLRYSGTLATEWLTLPVFDWEGDCRLIMFCLGSVCWSI